MKKIICIFSLCCFVSLVSFAYPGCWGPPPPPHYYHHHCYGPYYYGNSGVALAANIVGLVGATLNIVRPPVVVQQPVYYQTQPVIIPQQQINTTATTIRIVKPDGTQQIITQPVTTTNTLIYR